MPKNPPEGMPRVTPYLFYANVGAALNWLEKTFGFEPVAERTSAGTPSKAISTFSAPNPMPVIVTSSPMAAQEGAMLLILPALAASTGWLWVSNPNAKATTLRRSIAKLKTTVGLFISLSVPLSGLISRKKPSQCWGRPY